MDLSISVTQGALMCKNFANGKFTEGMNMVIELLPENLKSKCGEIVKNSIQ